MSLLSKKRIATVALLLLADDVETNKKMKRTKWCKNWYRNRDYSNVKLLRELRENEPDDNKNYLRMVQELFDLLLELVRPYIEKQDTKLAATLRYLATGNSYEDLKFSTGIFLVELFQKLVRLYSKF